jgi:hypothetical protein
VYCFFLERQIKAYISAISSRDECILHVDATGSLISTLGEKTGRDTVYLYSADLAPGNLPVCEFLSTDHRSCAIRSFLEFFNNDVTKDNGG